jgi:hypothetical protein
MIGDFVENSKAAFPFTLASKDDQTIFSLDSVPEDFTLSDPDHLNAFKIDLLYNHFLSRQRKGLPPFVVLNGGPLHGQSEKSKKSEKAKGKRKAEYVDVGDSEDDGEVGDEDDVDPDGGVEEDVDGDGGEEEDVDGDGGEEEDVDGDGGEEDEPEEDEEDDNMLPTYVKYGPPNGKGKQIRMSTPVAGSSKLPPRNPFPKKKVNDQFAKYGLTDADLDLNFQEKVKGKKTDPLPKPKNCAIPGDVASKSSKKKRVVLEVFI